VSHLNQAVRPEGKEQHHRWFLTASVGEALRHDAASSSFINDGSLIERSGLVGPVEWVGLQGDISF